MKRKFGLGLKRGVSLTARPLSRMTSMIDDPDWASTSRETLSPLMILSFDIQSPRGAFNIEPLPVLRSLRGPYWSVGFSVNRYIIYSSYTTCLCAEIANCLRQGASANSSLLGRGWELLPGRPRNRGPDSPLAVRCPDSFWGRRQTVQSVRKLSHMAAASQGVTRDQLFWTYDAYIRDDSYRAALAVLTNAHHRLPFSRIWGDGTTYSSDGQFFRGAKRGDINARYGVDHGFSFYTHVSDQRVSSHVKVSSAATHEAPYVLDGLTSHGTDLKIAEHYTDTGGATAHVFALCAMLGFRFCPRLRDFPDRRLAPIAPVTAYPSITPLLGKRIRTDIIGEQWDDVLRLVGRSRPAMSRHRSCCESSPRTNGRTSST